MSHNLTPSSATFDTTTFTVPDDGVDFRTAASLYPALQRACNNDAWLGLNGFSTAGGNRALSAPLNISGHSVFVETLYVGGTSGTPFFTISSTGQIIHAAAAGGSAVIQRPWTFAGGINIGTGTNTFSSPITNATVVTDSGSGRSVVRTVYLLDEPATIGINDGSRFIMREATITANRTVTLSTTGAQLGDRIRVTCHDGVNHVSFTNLINSSGSLGGYLLKRATGSYASAEVVFNGTDWEIDVLVPAL